MTYTKQRVDNRIIPAILCLFLIGLYWFICAGNAPAGSPKKIPAIAYTIPISGEIDPGLAGYVARAIKFAGSESGRVILLEIDTLGGQLAPALAIRDGILNSELPVIALVKERAVSAGALIAISAEKLAMAPGSHIGSAEPRPRETKYVAAVRGEFEATAEKTGRDPMVAAAMVDSKIRIPGLKDKGDILDLTANKAVKNGIADFIAADRIDALNKAGYRGVKIETIDLSWSEKAARFLSQPVISSLLLVLACAGVLIEIFVPGFAGPGLLGVIFFILFFSSRMMAGLAGWEVILLFVGGIALLLFEGFVIPGFGVTGVAGIVMVMTGVYRAFASSAEALYSMAAALIVSLGLLSIFIKRFSGSSAWKRIVLGTRQSSDSGYTSARGINSDLVGKTGKAVTVLRPSGTVLVGDERIDAVTAGEFIPAGTPVTVVSVQGSKVIVKSGL